MASGSPSGPPACSRPTETGSRREALPILLGELARTVVLAVVLWGVGDLVRLMITVGNDVRAERILLARLVFRTPAQRAEDEGMEGDPITGTPRELLDPSHQQRDEAAAD